MCSMLAQKMASNFPVKHGHAGSVTSSRSGGSTFVGGSLRDCFQHAVLALARLPGPVGKAGGKPDGVLPRARCDLQGGAAFAQDGSQASKDGLLVRSAAGA